MKAEFPGVLVQNLLHRTCTGCWTCVTRSNYERGMKCVGFEGRCGVCDAVALVAVSSAERDNTVEEILVLDPDLCHREPDVLVHRGTKPTGSTCFVFQAFGSWSVDRARP